MLFYKTFLNLFAVSLFSILSAPAFAAEPVPDVVLPPVLIEELPVAESVFTVSPSTTSEITPVVESVPAALPPPPTEEQVTIDPIVISAHLVEEPRSRIAQTVDVITAEEIAESGAISLADVLRQALGTDVVSLSTPGDDTDIRLRGADRDETLVLLDGLALNNLIDSRVLITAAIPVELIERIEILRGAASVAYGSSAVGGVINIITKKSSEDFHASLGSLVGTLSTYKETATTSGSLGKQGFAGSFSRLDRGGHLANSSYTGNSAFTNFNFVFSDKLKLHVGAAYLGYDQELPIASAISFAAFPTITLYNVFDADRNLSRHIVVPQATLTYDPFDFWRAELSYGMYYEDTGVDNSNAGEVAPDPAATLESQAFDSKSHRHTIHFKNILTLARPENTGVTLKAIFGTVTDLEYLSYTDAAFAGDASAKVTTTFPDATLGQKGFRRNTAGYGQLVGDWSEELTISGGVRYDDNSTYGHAISPRVSAAYRFTKTKTKISGNYSRGFMAPSLNQYYLAVIGGTLTQRLDKEVSDTFDAGVSQELKLGRVGKLHLGSTAFYTRYDTYINEVQLINNAHVVGLENSLRYDPAKWLEIDTGYTFTHAVNDDDGSTLSNRPAHRFFGTVTARPVKNLSFAVDVQAVSSRVLPTILSTNALGDLTVAEIDVNGIAAPTALPSYITVGATARYKHPVRTKVIREIEYSVTGQNLTNASYQERFSYPMPGITVLGGITLHY